MTLKELLETHKSINTYFKNEVDKLNSLNLDAEVRAMILKGIQIKYDNEIETLKQASNS